MNQIPSTVFERIRAFLDGGRTGSIEIHMRQGRVVQIKVTETQAVNHDGVICLQETEPPH